MAAMFGMKPGLSPRTKPFKALAGRMHELPVNLGVWMHMDYQALNFKPSQIEDRGLFHIPVDERGYVWPYNEDTYTGYLGGLQLYTKEATAYWRRRRGEPGMTAWIFPEDTPVPSQCVLLRANKMKYLVQPTRPMPLEDFNRAIRWWHTKYCLKMPLEAFLQHKGEQESESESD